MKLITKRKLIPILCLCVTVTFTACQKTDKENTEPSGNIAETNDSANGQAAASNPNNTSDASTHTVSTIMGDVEVPVNPVRIIALGNPGDLVSMGVKPIAGDNEVDLFDGLLTADTYTKITSEDYEGIMALEPDLILIADTPKKEEYKKLTAIAPTVATEAYTKSLSERIIFTGKVIGKEADAKKALSEFETQAETYKAQLKNAGIENKTITVMEGTYLFGDKYGRGADIYQWKYYRNTAAITYLIPYGTVPKTCLRMLCGTASLQLRTVML